MQLRVGGRGRKGWESQYDSPAPLPAPAVPLALRHGVRAASGEPGHRAPLGGPDGAGAARGTDPELHQRARALLRHLQVRRDPAADPSTALLAPGGPGWLAVLSCSRRLLRSLKHSLGWWGSYSWGTATVEAGPCQRDQQFSSAGRLAGQCPCPSPSTEAEVLGPHRTITKNDAQGKSPIKILGKEPGGAKRGNILSPCYINLSCLFLSLVWGPRVLLCSSPRPGGV